MRKIFFLLMVMVLVVSISISCTRVAERPKGELKTEQLAKFDSLPLDYGKFVGITADQQFPREAQLWFEDDNRTIRIATVSLDEKRVEGKVTVIPRY